MADEVDDWQSAPTSETDDWQSAPTPEADDWQAAQPATSQSEVDDWQAAPAPKPQADDWQAAPLPQAESPFWSGVRKFAHGIGPTLAGAAAGAATMGGYGAAAGTLGLPGLGTLGGTLIGGAAGLVTGGVSGYLASEAQEAAAKALNFDDSLQQAANEQANPGSTLIGGALTAAVPFGMGRGVVTLGQRAFSGALMGGVETGSELAEGKPFDPAAIALNVGMGAAFPQPRKFLTPFESAGARLGTRLTEQFHGKAGPDAAGGVAQEQPSPKAGTTVEPGAAAATPEATAPAGDRGGPEDYGKDTPTAAERQGVNVGETDPAQNAAIRAKMAPEGEAAAPPPEQPTTPAGAVEPEIPTATSAKLEAQFPRVPNEQARPLQSEEPPAAAPSPIDAPVPSYMEANRGEAIRAFGGTPIEARIIELARAGKTAKEIEQATGVSAETVRYLRDNAGVAPAGPMGGMIAPELPGRAPTPREAIEQRAPGETVGDVLRQPATLDAPQEAHSLSAAAAPPTAPITTSAPPSTPAGKIFGGLKQAADNLFDMTSGLVRDLQMKVAPMATGTKETILPAKDFANRLRQIHQDWQTADEAIVKKFNPEQQKRIWDAMNEEREMQKKGEVNEHMGVATLEPDERAFADDFHEQAKARWARLVELGAVKGEGEPYWTPIMLAHAMDKGEGGGALDRIGGNLKTTTGSLKRRKYETAEETEAAMKKLFGEQAGIARNARVMPLAISKLDQVIAGRELVDKIREIGKATGVDTVAAGSKPGPGWFHIDHPALYDMRIRPRMEEADTQVYREAVEGHGVVKVPPAEIPLFDRNGKPVLNYDRVPLWIRGDFEGPLRAVLTKPSGVAYDTLMALKGKTTGVIMISPAIHLGVELGRALPTMPGKIITGRALFDGNRAKYDPVTVREAIGGGQVPIGKRFFNQDITSMMEQPDLTPGRSWTAKVLAFAPGLFDEKAGLAVKRAIDKAGDFWHNTLLWDRIRDLQMGLYVNYRDEMIAKGIPREQAVIMAAHESNRFAGSLPQEAMSSAARKTANLLLFSRTFTMGNLGVMKDMFTGAPKDVLAMLDRAGGDQKDALTFAKNMARRKAISIVALDMGLMYLGNSLLQSASNVMRGDTTLDQEGQGYADRLSSALKDVRENPLSMLQPLKFAQSLSATSMNEPGKQDRILVGHTKDGTGIYARNPIGKFGEELAGYMSGPLDMLRRKLGTLARPTWQVLSNDKGFGRKVYDPNADSIGDYVKNAGAIATHFATAQTPDVQASGAYNLLTGQGDPTLAAAQTLGPMVGVTASRGAPGGPAVGVMYKEAERQRFAVNEALPEIRQMITNNDIPGAMKRMIELKMPAWQRNNTIRQTLNPSTRITPTAVRKFNQTATPAERDLFNRMRQQNLQ